MRAGIDKYQRIRYQSRSGKGGRGSYKESLAQRNKNQKESRSKGKDDTARTQI